MNRIVGTRMLVAVFAVAVGWMPLAGQVPPAGGPGGGGRGGPPQLMDLATAKRGVDAAEAACVAANVKVSIAVVDANGDLVYFRRMDGAISPDVASSQRKARTAILFGVPTKAVADAATGGTPLTATLTAGWIGTSPLTILQGGLPIVKNGKVIGGIAAGGSTTTNDDMCAKAGLDAVLK